MFMPSVLNDSVWDVFMDDFGFRAPRKFPVQAPVMRTDVRETETDYILEMDLPGFAKEDVKAELKDGYMIVTAERSEVKEDDGNGKYIRRERCTGSVSRSFYVGEGVTEEDIGARFENGILTVTLPKEVRRKTEEKKYIAIAG